MAVNIVAKWKDSTYSEYKKLNAQNIYEELRSIGSSNGTPFESVSGQEFVDFARNNPTSESYKIFEWDDTVAAETYRRQQATIVKNCLITYELKNPQVQISDEDKNAPIPLFINPSHNKLKEHAPVEIVMNDEDLRKATLEKAYEELKSFQLKYHYLTELSAVFDAINSVVL